MNQSPWMQSASGRRIDIMFPTVDQIDPDDLVHQLSGIPRFLNATGKPWMVTEHSLLCLGLLRGMFNDPLPGLQLATLLHDGHEYIIGDITTPVKRAIRALLMTWFGVESDPVGYLADGIDRAIFARFGLPSSLPPSWVRVIKQVDLVALAIEKQEMMAPAPEPWVHLPVIPDCWAEALRFAQRADFKDQLDTLWRDYAGQDRAFA